MTRRNILNKYGFKYMSQVELDAELSEEEAIKFEEFIKELNDKFKLDELLQSGEEIEIEIKVGGIDENKKDKYVKREWNRWVSEHNYYIS